jgi:hypothetical protein
MKYANSRRLAIVPQGGNTGLVGGSGVDQILFFFLLFFDQAIENVFETQSMKW